jgi:hypothetical protein
MQSKASGATTSIAAKKRTITLNSITEVAPGDVVYYHPVVSPYDPPAFQAAFRKAMYSATKAIYGGRAMDVEPEAYKGAYYPTEHIWRIAWERLLKASQKHESTCNVRHTQQKFEVEEYIWVTSWIRQHRGQKWKRPSWLGLSG